MKLSDDRGWAGQPDRHDQLWGVIAVLLGMAGMAFLLIGQTGLYRVGMWVGGLR